MTRYHNIEQESAANLNEWRTTIANDTKFEQFSSTLPSALPAEPLKMIYFKNQYVLFTKGRYFFVSANLTDWERRDLEISTDAVNCVFHFDDVVYVIYGTYGNIKASSDLKNWFGQFVMSANNFYNPQIGCNDTTIVGILPSDKHANLYSLISYTRQIISTITPTNDFRSETGVTTPIIWAGDRFFFSNTSSPYCYYSLDGTNWVEVKLPFEVSSATGYYIQDIAGTTGKYYIIGDRINRVFYTSDFRTWENVSIPGELNYLRPHLFYHETLSEMVGIHQQYGLWFQEETPTKFTLVGPQRSDELKTIVWVGLCYNGEKYIVWSASPSSVTVYFATITDAYKDTNLSWALTMLLQKMDETNTKLQALIDKE